MPADVVHFIEHVARELDIACAIRYLAKTRHGLNVQIASLVHDFERTLAGNRAPLFAVPFFYSKGDAFIGTMLRKCPQVGYINLAFEQLLSKGNFTFRAPRDEVVRQHVTHLAGSRFFRDFLCEHGVADNNVVTVGSLPCQLYRTPYRRFFEVGRDVLAQQHRLDSARPWVFFPENYGAAFFSPRRIEERIRNGADAAETYAYCEFARKSFDAAMNWCAAAAEAGAVELIIRPRPATPQAFFLQEFSKATGRGPAPHLHFIKDGSIREWILASDIVVSSYSTSLIEATVAGKPAYMLTPVQMPECVHSDWNDHAAQITSQEQFVDLLRRPGDATLCAPLHRWTSDTLLSSGDALANVVEVLAAICSGKRAAPRPPGPLAVPAPSRVKLVQDGWREQIRKAKNWWRGGVKKLSALGHEQDYFSEQDIERRVERWAKIFANKQQRDAA